MPLQTIVKAGNITNLSDARYCAGMGVEIIGFPVGKSVLPVIEPQKIKEITGWISGIKIALELKEIDFDKNYLIEIIGTLNPDYIQVPLSLANELRKITGIPLLLSTEILPDTNTAGAEDYILFSGNIEQNKHALKVYSKNQKLILSGPEIDACTVLELLNTIHPAGIELKGGTEISPGLKTFDELSEILEILEVEE